MRVTGGRYAGRRLTSPSRAIRPAMDRMRESVFAVLGPLDGMTVLDLFSGSGSIAVEAASRGAELVHMVERDAGKRRYIEQNLAWVEEECRIFITPVERFLKRPAQSYDVVFADPPFAYPFKADLLRRIVAGGAAAEDSRIVIHYPSPEELPESVAGNTRIANRTDDRRYGGSLVSIYDVSTS